MSRLPGHRGAGEAEDAPGPQIEEGTLLMILMMKPSYLLKCVLYFSSFILKLLLAKRRMKLKCLKPRKGINSSKRLVIKRVPWMKIRINPKSRKTKIHLIIIMLMTQITFKVMGKMKLQMGETLTSTNPKTLAPKIIKCKVMKKKRHPLEMLKIILEGINYNQEMVEDNDSVEDGYTKVEQTKRNRENHSKKSLQIDAN